jgi:hypothetical protein
MTDKLFAMPKADKHIAERFDVSGILLEACAFPEKGGWSLDTQHYHQMGGNYLLAHGLGTPVADAATSFTTSNPQKYSVFVRTRNWCHGNWEPPGRFRVAVDGKELDATFGTEPGWAWQIGGTVFLDCGCHALTVRDLTGFDGRFDAVYLTSCGNPVLPVEISEIVEWKDHLAGRSRLFVEEEPFDLVVVGGGVAGCAAALAADSRGLKVALVQDRPVFGGNASAEFRIHTLGVMGKSERILGGLDNIWVPQPREVQDYREARDNQAHREETMAKSSVTILKNFMATGLTMEAANKICSIDIRHTHSGAIRRLKAPLYIDSTGDAWLGYWSGADYRYGREASTEFGESLPERGSLWSPEMPDNRVMGSTLTMRSTEEDNDIVFPEVPWATAVSGTEMTAIRSNWQYEYTDDKLCQINDHEYIRDHLLCAMYGMFYNAKQLPENKRLRLSHLSFIGGKRESRRLMGDYIYSMKDMTESRRFPDTVAEGCRCIDVHYQKKEVGSPYDFYADATFHKVPNHYYIPFRCLYSRNIDNLMMAGRCFSCSHIGLGGPRVILTGGQMGVATGFAAVLCRKYKTDPRGVYKDHIDELRKLIGYD